MQAGAVLCISCGFHTQLGGQLATVLDEDAPRVVDPNPYAAPAAVGGSVRRGAKNAGPYNDLTDLGARRAEAVVRDAEAVWKVLVIALCCCSLAWPLVFPWYGFRLVSWYFLNAEFKELQFPNSFSNHGALAARFQDAKFKLWVGAIAGAIFSLLLILGIALQSIPS
jgi:hypothetical protein